MTSSYVSGVFLTICTYEGPQLVYHYFDESLRLSQGSSDGTSDGEIEWSDEESNYGDDEEAENEIFAYGNSPPLAPVDSLASDLSEETVRTSARSRAQSSSHSIKLASSHLRSGATARSRSTSPSLPQQISRSGSLSRSSHRHMPSSFSRSSGLTKLTTSLNRDDILTSTSDVAPDDTKAVPVDNPSSVSLPSANFPANNSVGSSSNVAGTPNRFTQRSLGSLSLGSDSDSLVASPSTSKRGADLPCGLDEDILSELLTPPESMCNERFSISVDDCIFIGIPVHILGSGTWRPLKQKYVDAQAKLQDQNSTSNLEKRDEKGAGSSTKSIPSTNGEVNEALDSIPTEGIAPDENPDGSKIPRADDIDAESEEPKTESETESASKQKAFITDKDTPMRMFHVSFVLNPPITEMAVCEERVYNNILVPFVKMLRQEQASHNYVWNEVVKMQRVHESLVHAPAAEKQEAMESYSELARALRQMCGAISKMDIARILIGNKARAFQIPLQLELAQLPESQDQVSPHAYLSTINSPLKEIGHSCYGCYGLLLLDDPEVIVQEIEVDPQGPVAAMIRNIDPTASLEELAQQNRIELKQIVNLVWSLVYWRRARIIVPIHSRYTYGVSPLTARGERFGELANAYHQLFPMMPPMQKLMALLSTGKPKPFSMHIPSTDHRHIYMRTVSWMLQKDLIIHLQTFALIVVTRKIKISSMNTEGILDKDSNTGVSLSESKPADASLTNHNDQESAPRTHYVNHAGIPSEQLRPRKWMTRRKSSNRIELEEIEDSVILNPRNASPQEKKWLGQVAVSGLTRNPDLAAMFQRLTKYFNGVDCLEQVMILEKITRDEMRRFLHEFNLYIVTYKHW